jgi:methionine--tRNA ligase beta chain
MENPAKEISIDDFKRLELRIGTVIDVSKVPRTEKLYKVIVDLGEHGKKQTITSLVGYYSGEELLHKRVAFLCNLKEAKFAGQLSQGMLLAASVGDKLSLLTIDREIGNGARVS